MSTKRYIQTPISINARDPDIQRQVRQVLHALTRRNSDPHLFRLFGRVVRKERDDLGHTCFRTMTLDMWRYEIARVAEWYVEKKDGTEPPSRPSDQVVRDVMATPNLDLPILKRFSPVPIFSRDGILLLEGYHRDEGILIEYEKGFQLSEVAPDPDADDVQVAVDFIRELIDDFPFVSPSEISHTYAAILLPFMHELIKGPTPLHMLEKPAPGTGATLLAQCIGYISTGRWIPGISPPTDESEWRRTILAELLSRPGIFFIDNISDRLSSGALASAITGEYFADRRIGTSDIASAAIRCLWLATANNPELSAEIARRAIRIRLDAKTDRPELRTGFSKPNLKAWVEENHWILVWSALTLISAWLAAGRPIGRKSLGMFELWAESVGGVLSVCGVPGFLENIEEQRATCDRESERMEGFVSAWWGQFGAGEVGVAELWPYAQELDLRGRDDHSRKINLGRTLDSLRSRQFAGFRIERAGIRMRAIQYRLVKTEDVRVRDNLTTGGTPEGSDSE